MAEHEKGILSQTSPNNAKAFVPSYIWDLRFLDMARLVATWSKDPSTQVGAVAVGHRRRILGQGYNGFPSGIRDLDERYQNRDMKYGLVVHAEANVIYNACRVGVMLETATVYVYGMYPCPECVKALAQVGVSRIAFMLGESQNLSYWQEQWGLSESIMREVGIGHTHYKHRAFLKSPILGQESVDAQ